ncbi:hypothetical protein BY996DRAFT_8522861, partial [Phakopsora pachyrhizi]
MKKKCGSDRFPVAQIKNIMKGDDDRGSRKVQVYHLKQVIQVTEVFEFLNNIVSKIPSPLNGGMEE